MKQNRPANDSVASGPKSTERETRRKDAKQPLSLIAHHKREYRKVLSFVMYANIKNTKYKKVPKCYIFVPKNYRYLVFSFSFFYNFFEAEIKEKGNIVKERRLKNETKKTLPVDEFVNQKIVNAVYSDENPTWDERIANLNQYFDLSAAFHQPKGDGYKLVLHCLHKYLDFKFIRENNHFRFHESLFDQRVRIIPNDEQECYNYVVSDVGMGDMVDGSRADIYYLLHEADQEGIASRRCISYVNSNRLHLTAVLIQLIERIVDNLERNPLKKYQEYGHLIRLVYMSPENSELDIFELFDVLGYKKKKYYRVRNEAISLISETLFGILAGEHGFSDLYISESGIHVNQKM